MTTIKTTALAMGALAFLALAAPAQAAADTYGYVDMEKVLRTADAPKAMLEELEAKRKTFMEQAMKEENELRKADQDLAKQREKLSKEEFEKKVKEFQDRLGKAQQGMQKRKDALEKSFSDAMGKMRTEVLKVTADVAREKNYTGVFKDDALILSDESRNITNEVIARINKNVKKIPIK